MRSFYLLLKINLFYSLLTFWTRFVACDTYFTRAFFLPVSALYSWTLFSEIGAFFWPFARSFGRDTWWHTDETSLISGSTNQGPALIIKAVQKPGHTKGDGQKRAPGDAIVAPDKKCKQSRSVARSFWKHAPKKMFMSFKKILSKSSPICRPIQGT